MDFREALQKLNKSSEFVEWHTKHNNSYLSYGFIMIAKDVRADWQLGYYNPSNDTLTSFSVNKTVIQNPDAEIFKNKTKVQKLDLAKVKITLEKALDKSEKLQKEKYSVHDALKKIAILQNLDMGQVWNITYVTQTFKTLNIKINSETGEIVKYDLIDLFKVEK